MQRWSLKGLKPLMGHVTRPIKSSTYYQQPPMELDDVRDALAALCLSVGEVELEGDAKVAADDDGRRHGEVEGEHGDDKREALVFHLPPGEWAGHTEGFWPVPPPAQDGEQSPDESVQPRANTQHLYLLPADFLLCSERKGVFFCLSGPYIFSLYQVKSQPSTLLFGNVIIIMYI